MGGWGYHKGSVSAPVGTSGCTQWFGFARGIRLHCVPQATGGTVLSVGESATVVPLLTRAASAPCRPPPPQAGAGSASDSVLPMTVRFGGSPPHPTWEGNVTQGQEAPDS